MKQVKLWMLAAILRQLFDAKYPSPPQENPTATARGISPIRFDNKAGL